MTIQPKGFSVNMRHVQQMRRDGKLTSPGQTATPLPAVLSSPKDRIGGQE